jgi:hypothetical protein
MLGGLPPGLHSNTSSSLRHRTWHPRSTDVLYVCRMSSQDELVCDIWDNYPNFQWTLTQGQCQKTSFPWWQCVMGGWGLTCTPVSPLFHQHPLISQWLATIPVCLSIVSWSAFRPSGRFPRVSQNSSFLPLLAAIILSPSCGGSYSGFGPNAHSCSLRSLCPVGGDQLLQNVLELVILGLPEKLVHRFLSSQHQLDFYGRVFYPVGEHLACFPIVLG